MAETHIIAKEGCCFTPQSLRLLNRAIACQQGVSFDNAYGQPPLFVRAEGGGRVIVVNPGSAFVAGDRYAGEGMYFVSNDAPVELTVPPGDAADPRCDLVVARIPETGETCWELAIIQGVPSPDPQCPALPDSALVLAQVRSPAGSGSIENSDITDRREPYSTCTGEGNYDGYTPSRSNTSIEFTEARYTMIGDTVIVRVRGTATNMPSEFAIGTPVPGRALQGWTTGIGSASTRRGNLTGGNAVGGIVVPFGSGQIDDVTVISPRLVTNEEPQYAQWGPNFPFEWQEDGAAWGLSFTYERA